LLNKIVFVSLWRLLITFIDSVYVFENECKRIFRYFFAIIVINTNLCGRSKMDTFSQLKYGNMLLSKLNKRIQWLIIFKSKFCSKRRLFSLYNPNINSHSDIILNTQSELQMRPPLCLRGNLNKKMFVRFKCL